VFLSTDNGDTWSGPGLTNSTVKDLICIDPYLAAGTSFDGVQLSSDNGDNWFEGGDTGRAKPIRWLLFSKMGWKGQFSKKRSKRRLFVSFFSK
jgi:hypothetical protein